MKRPFLTSLLALSTVIAAHAQFSDLLQFAQTQQSLSLYTYKGFVEAAYGAGVGHYQANKLEITTSHGVTNGNIFAGIGAGIDILKTDTDHSDTRWEEGMDLSDNAYMVPLFLDFRYMGKGAVSAFVDCKAGVSFLVNDAYITIDDGIIDNDVSFYLSCGVGVRFALGAKSAFNVGINYSLISQRYYGYDDYYYYSRYDGISLHSIGISAGFEW